MVNRRQFLAALAGAGSPASWVLAGVFLASATLVHSPEGC
jgi:hypothetical protein